MIEFVHQLLFQCHGMLNVRGLASTAFVPCSRIPKNSDWKVHHAAWPFEGLECLVIQMVNIMVADFRVFPLVRDHYRL